MDGRPTHQSSVLDGWTDGETNGRGGWEGSVASY